METMMQSAVCLLEQAAEKFKNKTVFEDKDGSISFEELREKSRIIGSELIKRVETGRKCPVIVYLPKSIKSIISFMGSLYSASPYVPIDYAIPMARMEKTVENLHPTAIITDTDGKANWVSLLDNGVSRAYVLKGFTDSSEFNNLCSVYGIQQGTITTSENRDKNPQVTAFVNRLYTIAMNRAADVNGLNDWTGKLLAKTKTPKQVASGFVFSQEMANRNLSNQEYVTMLYRTMMDREPDEAGLNDWVTRLQSGTSRQSVFDGFADSTEFDNIVRAYGLK